IPSVFANSGGINPCRCGICELSNCPSPDAPKPRAITCLPNIPMRIWPPMLIKDVADSGRMPEWPATKSRTKFIFGPSNEPTNEEPALPPPALPNKPLNDSDQPPCGVFCFSISRRPVAPPADEACAAAEPSSAGNACCSAVFVPSGSSPTVLLICPSISGDNCSRIIFRIFMRNSFVGATNVAIYRDLELNRARPLASPPYDRPHGNQIPNRFFGRIAPQQRKAGN